MMRKYNQERVIIYNTYQLYRHDKLAHLKRDHAQATKGGFLFGAKLVRGAYMEKERERAAEMDYPSPIQPDKASTDRDFDLGVEYCVMNYETIASCCASHNVSSNKKQADKYVPYGPIRDVVPYLIRRAQENTSVTGEMSRELSLIKSEVKRRGI